MELRWFDCTKRQVPVIGQGTWYNDEDDRDMAVAALRRGIDLGIDSHRHSGNVPLRYGGTVDRGSNRGHAR